MNEPHYMTPAQIVEEFTWTSRSAIYSAIKDGLLPHYRLPSKKGRKGKYLVKRSDFLAFVEGTRTEGAQEDDGPLTFIK